MSNTFWIQNAEDFLSFEHPSERDVMHPIIVDKINSLKPQTYLDFGAGDGRMTSKVNDDILIDIYDISPIMIAGAKKILGHRLSNIYTDITKIPANYYDVIACSMVLICIDNKQEYEEALSAIENSLKPGGVAIFSVTHPCFRQSFFCDFYTEFSKGKEFDYFNESKPFEVTIHDPENINKVKFEDYHWSLSHTVNSMVKAGLSITELIETPDDKNIAGYNKLTSPFLILIVKKNEK